MRAGNLKVISDASASANPVMPRGWTYKPTMEDGSFGPEAPAPSIIVHVDASSPALASMFARWVKANAERIRAIPVERRTFVVPSRFRAPTTDDTVRMEPVRTLTGEPLMEDRVTAWEIAADPAILRDLIGDPRYMRAVIGACSYETPVPESVRALVQSWHEPLAVAIPRGAVGSGPKKIRTVKDKSAFTPSAPRPDRSNELSERVIPPPTLGDVLEHHKDVMGALCNARG